MNEQLQNVPMLLPSGLFDLIGAQAEAEARLTASFIAHARACGYVQVQPPLMEFAASLLGSQEETPLAQQSFRVMDPLSQQMLALRADMTMQIARIASNTMAAATRPLRLCYAGQTLRTLPDAMRQTRQFRQMGLEMFGEAGPMAEVELLQTAISALGTLGIAELTLDLSLPSLLPVLLSHVPTDQQAPLLHAVRHKDIGQIEQLGQPLIAELCAIAEPAATAIDKLKALALPEGVADMLARCEQILSQLSARLGNHVPSITLDALEMRGFGYHSGISFALYAEGSVQELGRGGRYMSSLGEPACGITLYGEDILPLLTHDDSAPKLMLPKDCDEQTAAQWRAKGYSTVYTMGLDIAGEAKAAGCTEFLNDDLTQTTKV